MYKEGRRKIHIVHRLINDLQGDKELAIFWCSDVGDFLEEGVVSILYHVEPRLRKIWPVIIDDQEEALGASVVHWVEREMKSFSDLDGAKEIIEFLSIP
jgi:hypothetical protein